MIRTPGRSSEPHPILRTYTATQVCELLSCSRWQFHALVHRQELTAFKVGRSYCVTDENLRAFIERKQAKIA